MRMKRRGSMRLLLLSWRVVFSYVPPSVITPLSILRGKKIVHDGPVVTS